MSLCNVSIETLHSLRGQVPSAFQKLQALVRNSSLAQNATGFSPSIEAQASTSSIHPSSSPPTADGLSLPKSISSLIEALNRDSVQIEDFLSRSEFEDIRDELKRMIEDPRVVDLQLDKRQLSDKVRFRKCLSQRSLAIEYSQ